MAANVVRNLLPRGLQHTSKPTYASSTHVASCHWIVIIVESAEFHWVYGEFRIMGKVFLQLGALVGRKQSLIVRSIKTQTKLLTDTFTPATFGRLEVSEKAPIIDSYLSNGFIIRTSVVYGSVGLLPRGFFNWKVTQKITVSLTEFMYCVCCRYRIGKIWLQTALLFSICMSQD